MPNNMIDIVKTKTISPQMGADYLVIWNMIA